MKKSLYIFLAIILSIIFSTSAFADMPKKTLVIGDSFAGLYECDNCVKIAHGGASIDQIKELIAKSKIETVDTIVIMAGVANVGIHGYSIEQTHHDIIDLIVFCIEKFKFQHLIAYDPAEMLRLSTIDSLCISKENRHLNARGYEVLEKTIPQRQIHFIP